MGSIYDKMKKAAAPPKPVEPVEKAAEATHSEAAAVIPVVAMPGSKRITKEEFRKAASAHTLDALATLADIMEDPNNKVGDRIRSAEILLSYGAGKPSQAVELSGLDGGAIKSESVHLHVHATQAAQAQAPDRLAAIARILLNSGGGGLLGQLPGGNHLSLPGGNPDLLGQPDGGATQRAGEVVDAEDVRVLDSPADGDPGGVPSP